MKKTLISKVFLLSLVLTLVFFSCENDEPLNNPQEDPTVQLTLKKVVEIDESPLNTYNQFEYNTDGQPLLSDTYFDNALFRGDKLFYNSNGTRDSIFVDSGFEPGYYKYSYASNQLTSIAYKPGGSQLITYNLTYNGNSIQATSVNSGNVDVVDTFTFSDATYAMLLSHETLTDPNTNSISQLIIEYTYDSNGNIASVVNKTYNTTSSTYDTTSTITYTYDDKPNPFKNTSITNPILLYNKLVFGVRALADDKISSHNVMSAIQTLSSGTTSTTTNVYQYNEDDYPIALTETVVTTDASGTETDTRINTKTYTYYEQ